MINRDKPVCTCEGGPTGTEHHALVARVNRSFEQDKERALLALKVATSEALQLRTILP